MHVPTPVWTVLLLDQSIGLSFASLFQSMAALGNRLSPLCHIWWRGDSDWMQRWFIILNLLSHCMLICLSYGFIVQQKIIHRVAVLTIENIGDCFSQNLTSDIYQSRHQRQTLALYPLYKKGIYFTYFTRNITEELPNPRAIINVKVK